MKYRLYKYGRFFKKTITLGVNCTRGLFKKPYRYIYKTIIMDIRMVVAGDNVGSFVMEYII